MPSELRTQHTVLCAQFARLEAKPRASRKLSATVLIHVYVSAMSIMIGIDETPADDAARIGTRHYDDDNNFCGARAPCALPCGSEAFVLFIACARKEMDSAIVSRSSERRNDGLRGSIPS